MFWNRKPNPADFTARESLGLLLPIAGVIVFVLGWCNLMFEAGHATRDPVRESSFYGTRENKFPATVNKLNRKSATECSLWLFAGTGLFVLGLLVARKQFTLYILLAIAVMIGASGALPYIFLKQ